MSGFSFGCFGFGLRSAGLRSPQKLQETSELGLDLWLVLGFLCRICALGCLGCPFRVLLVCRCFANGFVLKWSGQHGGFPKLADVTGQRATCGGSRCLWESAVSVRFVSHMTGTSTKIGLQIEGYHSQPSEMWKALGPNETQNDRMI